MQALKPVNQNLRVQKWVAAVSVILLAVKFIAYYKTYSVAILTDALESIVNVAAGFIGLYSLYVASKPRDTDHPYGHGKAEFLSAAIEGTLIGAAGVLIIYKSVFTIFYPASIYKIDTGIYLVAITAVLNFFLGIYCERIGHKNNSMALIASGKHLQSDTYSTLGIIVGLILLWVTGMTWIDSVIALVFGLIILWTSYKILKRSIDGIMDAADLELLGRLVDLLNANRRQNWIDMHNVRVIKYGSVLHLDCHLTLPWYLNLHEGHQEIDALAALVRKEFGESMELFVHSDGCLPFSCPICDKMDCPVRNHNFEKKITWTLENISQNEKHRLSSNNYPKTVE